MSLKTNKKKLNKSVALTIIKNYVVVALGCLILAFGDAAFLTPCNIVSGGVSSIGIILNYYLKPLWHFDTNSLFVAIIEIGLLFLGLAVLGKRFAARTAFASLVYPAFYAIFLGVNIGKLIGLQPMYDAINAAKTSGNIGEGLGFLLLAAFFGGALVGTGVALGYLGYGSTGGLDVIAEIIAKYTDMKQDISGFLMDALIIVVGICVFGDMINGLVGVLAAFCCALAVQYVYVYLNSYVIVDIISDKHQVIQDYIHKEMDHATTIVETVGGYTGEPRKMIRVVIYHNETGELRSFIGSVDPKAFISFTEAQTINGEGFEPLMVHVHKKLPRFLSRALDADRNIHDSPEYDEVEKEKHEANEIEAENEREREKSLPNSDEEKDSNK